MTGKIKVVNLKKNFYSPITFSKIPSQSVKIFEIYAFAVKNLIIRIPIQWVSKVVALITLFFQFFYMKNQNNQLLLVRLQRTRSTVYSGNSKRLNSEQSLISEDFWWHRLFYNTNYMLNSKLHKICQPLISELKFWNFPLFYRIIYAIYVNKRYLCPKNGKTICYGVLWILQLIKTKI